LNHTNGNHYDVVKSTSIVDITEKGQNKKRKASPEFGKDCLSKKRRTNEKGLNKKRKVSPEFGKDHLNKNRRTSYLIFHIYRYQFLTDGLLQKFQLLKPIFHSLSY
jgi:hypothetical protein